MNSYIGSLNGETEKKKQKMIGTKIRTMVEAGLSNAEIGVEMGLPESKVRILREKIQKN